jgi:hypothetical protein
MAALENWNSKVNKISDGQFCGSIPFTYFSLNFAPSFSYCISKAEVAFDRNI